MTEEEDLKRQIDKLEKINKVLMARVERSMDQQGNAYSLFTTAIGLEVQNRARTNELHAALESLERSNDALVAARDTAEQAVQVKTRFFTSVGHDVLQPLHAARLSLSALGESDEISEHKKLAKQIDHALYSIEELLRTILDISKLEAGITQPALQDIRLAEIFANLNLDFEPLIKEKGLAFSSNVSPDIGISSDPLMLRRILQNLLANAVRYTTKGKIALKAQPTLYGIKISVTDTGPGIPASEKQRIFEEFQRGRQSNTEPRQRGGFGLGLSIVQRMAKALEHEIQLESEVGVGTQFSIIVPKADISGTLIRPLARPEPADREYDFNNTSVLVIENDEQVKEAMQLVLKQWSFETHTVKSTKDVSAFIANGNEKPDIILADFHLDHNVCGLDAVATLRAKWGQNLPVIVITADHDHTTTERVLAANCELLHKPVRPAELRALIKHMLVA